MNLPRTAFGPSSLLVAELDAALTRLAAIERRIRQAEADRVHELAIIFELAAAESQDDLSMIPDGPRAELAYRASRAEIAALTRQSEHTVERQLCHAQTLTHDYPNVYQAYRAGTVSEQHTRVIIDAGTIIGEIEHDPNTETRRQAYETAVLEVAVRETPARLRPIARRLAEEHAEHPIAERHERARTRRRVVLVDQEDGMADVIAHLPAVEAHSIYQRLTVIAQRIEQKETAAMAAARSEAAAGTTADAGSGLGAGATSRRRLRDEIRTDLFADLLLTGEPVEVAAGVPGNLPGIQAHVQVIVPATALGEDVAAEAGWPAHSTLEPAVLGGYGPISPDTARDLAAETPIWELIRTNEATGEVLSVERYRPSEAMRRLLRVRDQRCRFIGCRRSAIECDLDHTIDAAKGGPTATTNLASLCRGHHTLKHHTGWRVSQRRDGTLDWVSPTGRGYTDRPPGSRPGNSGTAGSKVRFEPAF